MKESSHHEIFINSLKEEYLFNTMSTTVRGSEITIRLNSSLFYFGDTEQYNSTLYNKFDYILFQEGEYLFAFNRDYILLIISVCQKLSLTLKEVSPDFSNFSEKNNPFLGKINFLSQEYAVLFEKKEHLQKVNFGKKEKFIYGIFIIFTAIFFIFNWSYIRKIQNLKGKIALKERFIQEHNKKFQDLKKLQESKEEFGPLLNITTPKIVDILSKIDKSSNKNILYEEIIINKTKLKIIGSTTSLTYLHLFEKNLLKNGFINLNNEFIKSSETQFSFSLDCEVVPYEENFRN